MNLSWKLFFITTPIFVLFLTVFGTWIIQDNFQSGLNQEIERCMAENQTFQNSYELTRNSLSNEQWEQMTLKKAVESFHKRREEKNGNVRIYDATGTVLYQDNALEISSSVREKLDETNNVGYEIVPQQGNVYMVVVCRSGFDDYIETVRNITKIYENRDSMYSRYQMGMLALTVLVGGIILVVLFFVMRGMQKLSKAARQFAGGKYDVRLHIRSNDEVGRLAEDFNWMAGEMSLQMKKLEQEVQRQEEFTAAFAHELKTPLTSIIGSTSAMIENPDLPEEDRLLLLTDVRDDAQWLIRVVENLLSITRMGDTTTRLVKNPEPAEEILGAVTAKFRKRYPDVRIRVSVPEDLLFVPMDAVLISQVLSNLLENAVVHGGGHTTEIRLSVRREGPEAVFAVEDNGDGIEHKVLPHLFDGTLAAAAGDMENGGKRNMGLGLSVCQAIIHAHSGSIEAHNLMEGAEFVFRLPLEQEEEKA